MSTFEQAVRVWAEDVNNWYKMKASEEEMQKAFSMLVEYREQFDEPGEPTYVETFFKNKDGSWSTWLDTVDREHLAALVEKSRAQEL